MLSEGQVLVGESGKRYLAVSPLGQANVWTAVEEGNYSNIVVIKEPNADDTAPGWPSFRNEMIMHEFLKDCGDAIREQVDRIPPVNDGESPKIVLQIFESTLWTARTKRPFTTAEAKAVTKGALTGLRDIHARGLVYADLKMQNIMVDGFDVNAPSDGSHLTAKLGDLGIVMEPAEGKVQPLAYRAPEVYFKGVITSKADIWGWGLIYCHLLEAQHRFGQTGLYDDLLPIGSGTIPEREQAIKQAISNDYKPQNDDYFKGAPLPAKDGRKGKGDQWEELRRRGLRDSEVDFLRWVMRADPRKRPSAQDILNTGWLDKTEEETEAGFELPVDEVGRVASMEFDPTRSSPAEQRAQREADKEIVPGYNYKHKMVDSSLAEVYAARATAKRMLSSTPETNVISKKAYVPTTSATSVPLQDYQQGNNQQGQQQAASAQPTTSYFQSATDYTQQQQPSTSSYSQTTPSFGQSTPSYNQSSPVHVQSSPSHGQPTPNYGQSTPNLGQSTPSYGQSSPSYIQSRPSYGQSTTTSSYGQSRPSYGQTTSSYGQTTSSYGQPTADQTESTTSTISYVQPTTDQAQSATQQPPTRPGLSTTNTGTFLSYR